VFIKEKATIGQYLGHQMKVNFKQYAMLIALAAIWVFFGIATGGVFFKPENITNIFTENAHIMVLALGMVLVIVAGHIDLSVGSIAGFTGAIAAILHLGVNINPETGLNEGGFGLNIYLAIGIALVVAMAIGAFQGYWIAYQGIPAFIVTLAGMTIFRGATLVVTGSETVNVLTESFQSISSGYLFRLIPKALIGTGDSAREVLSQFHELTAIVGVLAIIGFIVMAYRGRAKRKQYGFDIWSPQVKIFEVLIVSIFIGLFFGVLSSYNGLPNSLIIVLLLVGFYHYLTNNTVFGRHVYAIGGNKEAAKLSGINIKAKTLWIFISMGFLSGLSGIIITSKLSSAMTSAGNLFELDTIAAAIIGGTSTLGGEGTVVGAIIGATLMASVSKGMLLMGVPAEIQMILRGVILLLAVWFDISTKKRSK
jgi:D-xylose transport system permease protein